MVTGVKICDSWTDIILLMPVLGILPKSWGFSWKYAGPNCLLSDLCFDTSVLVWKDIETVSVAPHLCGDPSNWEKSGRKRRETPGV